MKRINCKKTFRTKRELCFALPPDTFRLVSSLETAIEILDRLKELYSRDDDLKHSVQTTLHFEFGSFKQKYDENLDHSVN